MIAAIYRLFFAKTDLRDRRNAALARYQDAKRRGDTRAQAQAWPALNKATHDALRAGK